MNIKDIVKVALFSVISFILFMIGSILGGLFGVYGMYMSHAISAFLSIPVYMIMCRQIKKRGIVFLYFAIFGIVYTVMGLWPMLPVCLIAGLIGELILLPKDSFEKPLQIALAGVIAYVVYALHGHFSSSYLVCKVLLHSSQACLK